MGAQEPLSSLSVCIKYYDLTLFMEASVTSDVLHYTLTLTFHCWTSSRQSINSSIGNDCAAPHRIPSDKMFGGGTVNLITKL